MQENKIGEKAFAEGVAEQLKQYLPPEYEDMKCEVVQKNVNNGEVKIGISFLREGQNVAPIFYVDSHYQDVRRGKPLEGIMQGIAEEVQSMIEETDYSRHIDMNEYDEVKDYLSVELLNTKANRHMLAEMPHRKMEDLSMICVLRFPSENGVGRAKISNSLMEKWNIGKEELFQTAMENSQRKEIPVLQGLSSVLAETMLEMESDENLFADIADLESISSEPMFVLTNEDKMFGAAVMAYPGVMDQISQLLPEGFYILPSSVHEVMIFPNRDNMSEKEIGEMVRDVNASVEKSEVLSDRAYKYDKERGQICQVPESIEREKVMER